MNGNIGTIKYKMVTYEPLLKEVEKMTKKKKIEIKIQEIDTGLVDAFPQLFKTYDIEEFGKNLIIPIMENEWQPAAKEFLKKSKKKTITQEDIWEILKETPTMKRGIQETALLSQIRRSTDTSGIATAKVKILGLIYSVKCNTPSKIYGKHGETAPDGLKRKQSYNQAISQLVDDKWLNKAPIENNQKRSVWTVNEDKIIRACGLTCAEIFVGSEWLREAVAKSLKKGA